ncbi:RNA-directed DNA polymerase, eukaryota, reverse transcriptase zinc-binding domain protein, partial [Tanacetum coccineum]
MWVVWIMLLPSLDDHSKVGSTWLTDNHATGSVKSIDDMTIAEYLEYEEIRKAQGREKQLPFSNKSESELYDEQQTLLTTIPLVYAYVTSLSAERTPNHNTQNDDEEDISEWNWEAQIDQLRKLDSEIDECKMIHLSEDTSTEYISCLLDESIQGSFTLPCSINLLEVKAIADLKAGINVMSKSIFEKLGLGKIEKTNVLLVMPDKNSNGITFGQGFLENIHAEIDVFTREVSLRDDNAKCCEQEHTFIAPINEVCLINTFRKTPTSTSKEPYEEVTTHWCEPIHQEIEGGHTIWASCDPYHEEGMSRTNWIRARYGKVNDVTKERITQEYWNKKLGNLTDHIDWEDPKDCEKTKASTILGTVVNKLPEEWFSKVNKDADDLEGILNYLEPVAYEGPINLANEAYNVRRCKLLGMPYNEPPPILKEEAIMTRYDLGGGEIFTKSRIFNIENIPRTTENLAEIRSEVIKAKFKYEDKGGANRKHWCRPICQWKEDKCTKWASCNPHFDECDGGDNPHENKQYWESNNDELRTTLEWDELSFDDWVMVAFGKVCFSSLKAFIETSSTLNHTGIRACSKKEASDNLLIMDAMLREFLFSCLKTWTMDGRILPPSTSPVALSLDVAFRPWPVVVGNNACRSIPEWLRRTPAHSYHPRYCYHVPCSQIRSAFTMTLVLDSKDAGTDGNLIGQFGVGFYSAFLVADKWSSQQKVPDKKYVWEGEANTSSYIVQEETDPEKLIPNKQYCISRTVVISTKLDTKIPQFSRASDVEGVEFNNQVNQFNSNEYAADRS